MPGDDSVDMVHPPLGKVSDKGLTPRLAYHATLNLRFRFIVFSFEETPP